MQIKKLRCCTPTFHDIPRALSKSFPGSSIWGSVYPGLGSCGPLLLKVSSLRLLSAMAVDLDAVCQLNQAIPIQTRGCHFMNHDPLLSRDDDCIERSNATLFGQLKRHSPSHLVTTTYCHEGCHRTANPPHHRCLQSFSDFLCSHRSQYLL